MAIVALTDTFGILAVANCLWGLGWALTSGADVAWITDELERDDLIDQVLTAQARVGLIGTMVGIVVLGVLAWTTTLAIAIGVAGLAMIGLGLAMVARWPESGFTPVESGMRVAASWCILRRGTLVTLDSRVIAVTLIATFLINGAAQGFGRLYALRLVDVGLPVNPDPILWFAAIAVLAAAIHRFSRRRGAHRWTAVVNRRTGVKPVPPSTRCCPKPRTWRGCPRTRDRNGRSGIVDHRSRRIGWPYRLSRSRRSTGLVAATMKSTASQSRMTAELPYAGIISDDEDLSLRVEEVLSRLAS